MSPLWQVTQATMKSHHVTNAHQHFFGSTRKENWSASIWASLVQQIVCVGLYFFKMVVRPKNVHKKLNLGSTSASLGAQIQGEQSNICGPSKFFFLGPSFSPWSKAMRRQLQLQRDSQRFTIATITTTTAGTGWLPTTRLPTARYWTQIFCKYHTRRTLQKLQCQVSFVLLRQR